jgi:hypothetical protein
LQTSTKMALRRAPCSGLGALISRLERERTGCFPGPLERWQTHDQKASLGEGLKKSLRAPKSSQQGAWLSARFRGVGGLGFGAKSGVFAGFVLFVFGRDARLGDRDGALVLEGLPTFLKSLEELGAQPERLLQVGLLRRSALPAKGEALLQGVVRVESLEGDDPEGPGRVTR